MNPIGHVLLVFGILGFLISMSVHKIDEGHVGVYYRVIISPVSSFLDISLLSINLFLKGWCFVDVNIRSWLSFDDAVSYFFQGSSGNCTLKYNIDLLLNNKFMISLYK